MELDSEEEDINELVLKRPCTSDEKPSEPKQKKQKVSVTKPNSEQAIKLVYKVTSAPLMQTPSKQSN
jgi:hypothetical protein